MDGMAEHIKIFIGGMGFLVVVGHAVNTFPAPQNPYGKWLLGVIQFAVGQRIQGKETLASTPVERV